MEKKAVIVYDSATGNTKFLAEQLAAALPGVPCGPVGTADVSGADLVFLGFWTDKGSCSEALRAFLPALAGKRVFLFSGIFRPDHHAGFRLAARLLHGGGLVHVPGPHGGGGAPPV